ncbi:hypothetical protein R3P38DRAFT_2808333 [Favolaschia claudopus]|uniref:Reverse transcriptase n=1 Tax=Favolaschia claudopus TaxID=2862362 RepID=A0AAV9ZFI6_9AGAR
MPKSFNSDQLAFNTWMARELAAEPPDLSPRQSYTREITLEDVEGMKKHIKKNGLDTAVGVDGFSYKDCLQIPNENLLEFFRYCLKNQDIPRPWLVSLLIGILKKDEDPFEPSSYRLIALEYCMLKILSGLNWLNSGSMDQWLPDCAARRKICFRVPVLAGYSYWISRFTASVEYIYLRSDFTLTVHPDDVELNGMPVPNVEHVDDIAKASTSLPGFQMHLNDAQLWADNNGCETSIPKCLAQVFGGRQKSSHAFHLDGNYIQQVKKACYLGIWFKTGSKNIFREQYHLKSKKASTAANVVLGLDRFVGTLPAWDLHTLYMACIDPYLIARISAKKNAWSRSDAASTNEQRRMLGKEIVKAKHGSQKVREGGNQTEYQSSRAQGPTKGEVTRSQG